MSDARRRGWALDAQGSWNWAEPSPLERRGAGVDALRGRPAMASVPVARPEPWYGPDATSRPGPRAVGAAAGRGSDDPTPIFHELTVDRTRRTTLRAVPDAGAAHAELPHPEIPRGVIPEPHPGSGPLPVQDPRGTRRGLAEVPTVPPPPGPGDPAAAPVVDVAPRESPEEEMRRRAERRRRPRETTGAEDGGRHALRAVEPTAGRHAMR